MSFHSNFEIQKILLDSIPIGAVSINSNINFRHVIIFVSIISGNWNKEKGEVEKKKFLKNDPVN